MIRLPRGEERVSAEQKHSHCDAPREARRVAVKQQEAKLFTTLNKLFHKNAFFNEE